MGQGGIRFIGNICENACLKNRGYIVSTVMSFVLDVCKSLLSALYTYVGRKNSEGPSLRSDFNRLVYGGKIIYNEIKYICWAVEARIHQNKDFKNFYFTFFHRPEAT